METAIDLRKIESGAVDIIGKAGAMIIATHEQEVEGIELVRAIKSLRAEIADTFDGPIEQAHKAHKAMLAAKKKHDEPLGMADIAIRGKIVAYQNEQEATRKAEESRLAEEAHRAQQKLIDAAAKKVNGLLAKSATIDGQIAALETGMVEGVSEEERAAIEMRLSLLRTQQQSILQSAEAQKAKAETAIYVAPVTPMAAPTPKVAGTSNRKIKKAVVTDPMALIKAVAGGSVAIGVITFDMTVLNKLVSAGAIIPGVRIEEERVLAVKR